MCGGVVVQSFTFELIFLSSQYSKNATKFDPGQENKYVAVELLEVNISILLPSFDDIVAQSQNSKRRKEKIKIKKLDPAGIEHAPPNPSKIKSKTDTML
jgi:hypothetical protein